MSKEPQNRKQAVKRKPDEAGSSVSNCKVVDLLIIGGGPACLGFFVNALKNGKFGELIQGEGVAVLDTGISFGGGNLCNYGINSNTSANGFVKAILRKKDKSGLSKNGALQTKATKPKGKLAVTSYKDEDRIALSPKM